MNGISCSIAAVAITFVGMFILVPVFWPRARLFGFTPSSRNASARSMCCSARWSAVIDEPGLHFLGPSWACRRPDRQFAGQVLHAGSAAGPGYCAATPVNSEEGAPMGIGIWYEMFISDPVAYLFKNADPRGSLAANVGNSTVRCLSNMKLADMLENRHAMSQTVRDGSLAAIGGMGLQARLASTFAKSISATRK